MKILFLSLFLFTGCSVNRFYRASDVTKELKNNASQLNMIAWTVDKDYQDKAAFFSNYQKEAKNKDSFIIQDLYWRLTELKNKRDLIMQKSQTLKAVNDGLLVELDRKKEVKESDPSYRKIENFAKATGPEVKVLFGEYSNYKTASTEFAQFALFTGNVFKKSTSSK